MAPPPSSQGRLLAGRAGTAKADLLFVRHGLSRDITKIEERIKEISQIKETYRIESSPSELWSQSSIGVVWNIEGSSTELRKEEFKALKDEILHTGGSCTRRPVISILGASGTGKTRLARKLYDDREIRESFEVISWICLPPRVRFEQYVDMILEQIRPQVGGGQDTTTGNTTTTTDADADAASSSTSRSGEKLKELLKGRRYLVVLDGLVDPAGNWNSLLALLPGDRANRESRVVITSQLSAKEMRHADHRTKPTVLDPLEPDQTDELFWDRVCGGGGDLLHQQKPEAAGLKEISTRVHGICRGLPLAVIVVGGILRTKAYPSEWKEVLSQKLETAMGEARAMRCLWMLAFEELPNHLKSCFLYLATAPENVLLGAPRMVRLWIAEGFVAPCKGKTLEEVGMGYLRELVSRGLVELVERDANARGGISKVAVHSLLHAFVQAEAHESGFLEIHHRASVLSPHAVRRLAIHNFVDAYVDIPDRFPKLRSLLCDFLEEEQDNSSRHHRRSSATQLHLHSRCAEWLLRACGVCIDHDIDDGGMGMMVNKTKLHQLSVVQGSRFLRVIDLHGVMLARVPDEIGGSVHLRYLGIRSCRLRQLPASISRLDNLQTLDVRGTQVESVADGFWALAALRHVLAGGALLLPAKCPSAHHHQLKQHLQTLDGVAPAAGTASGCCLLNHMIYLRSLRLCSIPESPEFAGALLLALEKMEFLVNLSLSGCLVPSGIFSNPSSRSLEALALHGRLDPPPSGPFFLPNLGKLTLSRSGPHNLTQDFIDKVAGLPNLCEMELLDGSYGAQELVFHKGGFPSLTKLKLDNLVELEKMELARGSAPELAILTSNGCTKMKFYDNRRTSSPDEGGNDEGDASDIEVSAPEAAGWMITQRGPVLGSVVMESSVDEVMMERSAISRLEMMETGATSRVGEAMMEISGSSTMKQQVTSGVGEAMMERSGSSRVQQVTSGVGEVMAERSARRRVKQVMMETGARSRVRDARLVRSSSMEGSSLFDRMKYAIHDYCAAIQYMDG